MEPASAQSPAPKRLQPIEAPDGRPPRWKSDEEDYVDLRPYLLALRERWAAIAAVTAAAAIATAIVTGFVLPKWYRATAVLRPISTPAVESRVAGLVGGLGGGLGGLGNVASMLGAGGSNDAEEYMAILRGFGFNVALVERHRLQTELLQSAGWDLASLFGLLEPKDQNWALYRILEKRFDCDYSIRTGNITLYLQARNRRDAERILGYYIDDLRDLLRTRQIRDSSSAIDSLEEEAKTTPDALERTQLYELIAKQVQLKKVAQVQADFAFRVLDLPAASDKPCSPRMILNSLLVGIAALFIFALCILARSPGSSVRNG